MNKAREALQFISSDDRDVWVMIGMALKSEFGEDAHDIWDAWSQQAASYNATSARSVWKSFKGQGVTIGTLYHAAKQNGWRDDGHQKPTHEQIEAQKRASAERLTREGQERIKAQQAAAKKAGWIMHQTINENHAYFELKGMKDLTGPVWHPDDAENLLCVPMRINGRLVGLQMIDRYGVKKFLSGQITAGAEYCIDNSGLGGVDWWVEGYATGLSLRACLAALKLRYRVHITFSASNLKRMAHSGYVIADNDESEAGKNAAMATELPYWMPPILGDDLNDVHKANGTFRTSQMLRKWLQDLKDEREYYSG